MVTNFVQSLRSEIDALEDSLKASPDPRVVKLQELKKLLALYGDPTTSGIGLNAAEPRPTRKWGRPEKAPGAPHKPGRKISPERQAAIEGTIKILHQSAGPIKTADLYAMLSQAGITVGGADPVNNYSALLYGRDEFQSHGRDGWTLKEKVHTDYDRVKQLEAILGGKDE